MANIFIPEIPDVPVDLSDSAITFLRSIKEVLQILTGNVGGNTKLIDYMETSGKLLGGNDTPEGAVTAVVGTLYLRANGGANTTLYVKETGTGNTGWAAK